MRLSEAMRKGARNTQRIEGIMFAKEGEKDLACALGAAVIGRFLEEETPYTGSEQRFSCPMDEFPILGLEGLPKELIPDHIIGYCNSFARQDVLKTSLQAMVLMLNDDFGWSRRAIAEWVETIEDWVIKEGCMPNKHSSVSAPAEEPSQETPEPAIT